MVYGTNGIWAEGGYRHFLNTCLCCLGRTIVREERNLQGGKVRALLVGWRLPIGRLISRQLHGLADKDPLKNRVGMFTISRAVLGM